MHIIKKIIGYADYHSKVMLRLAFTFRTIRNGHQNAFVNFEEQNKPQNKTVNEHSYHNKILASNKKYIPHGHVIMIMSTIAAHFT